MERSQPRDIKMPPGMERSKPRDIHMPPLEIARGGQPSRVVSTAQDSESDMPPLEGGLTYDASESSVPGPASDGGPSGSSSSGPSLAFYMSPDDAEMPPLEQGKAKSVPPSNSMAGTEGYAGSGYQMRHPGILMVTGGYDRKIRFWEFRSGHNYRSITNKGSHMNRIYITPNKRHIVTAGYPNIQFYDVNSSHADPEPIATYSGHKDNVTTIDFQHQGNWMISSSEDKSVRFWDLRIPRSCHVFRSKDVVNGVKLDPNQAELTCVSEFGTVRTFDLRTNVVTWEFHTPRTNLEPPAPMKCVDVKWDGSMMAAANAKGIVYVWCLRRHKDGRTTKCELFMKIKAHENHITKCCFSPGPSPTSLLVTCGADKTIKLWRLEPTRIKLERTLAGHQKWVWDCAFTRDGSYLMSASSDTTTKLWQVSTGTLMHTYLVPESNTYAVNCCALNDTDFSSQHSGLSRR